MRYGLLGICTNLQKTLCNTMMHAALCGLAEICNLLRVGEARVLPDFNVCMQATGTHLYLLSQRAKRMRCHL